MGTPPIAGTEAISLGQQRLREIDVLRGLAAVGVVVYHYLSRYHQMWGYADPPPGFLVGRYGVELFFIISGFVISMTLGRTTRSLDFVVSRFSRIFPAYWAAVALTFAVVSVLGLPGRENTVGELMVNFTMLQRFLGVKAVDYVYWTLAVELTFYVIMFGIHRLRLMNRIEWICLAWLAVQTGLVLAALNYGYRPPLVLIRALILEYAHEFVAGIVFFRIWSRGGTWWRHGLILWCMANSQMMHGGLTYLAVEPLCILTYFLAFYLVVYGRLRFIAIGPLVFLGTISYSLYLTHYHIGAATIRQLTGLGLGTWPSIAFAFVLALSLATAITFCIERPAMRWIRRSYSRVSSPVRAPEPAAARPHGHVN